MTLTKSKLALGVLLAGGTLAAGAAGAQDLRLLGYKSSLTASCNVGCSQLTLALALTGLSPTDNTGAAVPAAIASLQEYLRNVTFQIFGTNPTITGVSGVSGSFTSTIDNAPANFAAVVLTDPIIPLSTSSVGLTVNLAPGANVAAVSANGLGYVNKELKFLDANGKVVHVPPALPPKGGPFYQTGDFNAFVSVSSVPEPSSYTLMATGIAGLVALGFRRRRSA